jgi:hypothetical protein
MGRKTVLEKGGASMQDPVRYYITKRGEEPTVRSVKVAQSEPEDEDRVAPSADTTVEAKTPERPALAPAKAVERLVKGAIRGRSSKR